MGERGRHKGESRAEERSLRRSVEESMRAQVYEEEHLEVHASSTNQIRLPLVHISGGWGSLSDGVPASHFLLQHPSSCSLPAVVPAVLITLLHTQVPHTEDSTVEITGALGSGASPLQTPLGFISDTSADSGALSRGAGGFLPTGRLPLPPWRCRPTLVTPQETQPGPPDAAEGHKGPAHREERRICSLR
ncbi:unnamed protein product [Pleuronectes platessa]|uniref:Uncharacterized protein n=1 Tax=Pleuronectes platessa TaxID=8262 RepID=A0A9N7VD91_PLEPL|nr:unnamed protein product [Pleuronectes platessa]